MFNHIILNKIFEILRDNFYKGSNAGMIRICLEE